MRQTLEHIEQVAGGPATYGAAAGLAAVGTWMGDNWFLIISAIAVIIRIAIDIPRLYKTYFKKDNTDAEADSQ